MLIGLGRGNAISSLGPDQDAGDCTVYKYVTGVSESHLRMLRMLADKRTASPPCNQQPHICPSPILARQI